MPVPNRAGFFDLKLFSWITELLTKLNEITDLLTPRFSDHLFTKQIVIYYRAGLKSNWGCLIFV